MTYHIRVRASALIIQDESILLVEFTDENGVHYNLPGGGVDPGETIIEAVKREAREEASVEVEVGQVAFLYEYAPHMNENKYGKVHSLTTIFDCKLKDGEVPKLAEVPDLNQTDVKWVKLNELHKVVLYPNLRKEILNYHELKINIELTEEHLLEEYSSC
ncbi:NUDIX domain-containing protein [Peribacillus butanolivorans]|uniref:NUDIX domain-containing protein n=1 Tax=Peribacillus butanolivorans TaxID=421767 RepID=UPI0036DF76B7